MNPQWAPIIEKIRWRRDVLRWYTYGSYMADEPGEKRLESEPDEWWLRFLEEVPPNVVADAIGPRSMSGGCGGRGYHWVYDTDYPCTGCCDCSHQEQWKWLADQLTWREKYRAEHEQLKLAISGMEALANIGRAFNGAFQVGAAIRALADWAREQWNEVHAKVIGRNEPLHRWYRVTGGRGRAANLRGFEGECVATRQNEWGGRQCALKNLEGDVRWVAVGQVSPMLAPPEAIEKMEAAKLRIDWRGKKGDLVYHPASIQFLYAFWVGKDKNHGGVRLGIKVNPDDRREEPRWVDAKEVWPVYPSAEWSEEECIYWGEKYMEEMRRFSDEGDSDISSLAERWLAFSRTMQTG